MADFSKADDPRFQYAFPQLSKGEIELLKPYGREITVPKGEFAWKAGDRDMCMFVVVRGVMEIIEPRSGAFVADHKAGGFSGDVDIFSGRPAIVSGRAAEDMDLVKVPADCVRIIVGEHPELGEKLMRAFLVRRALLIEYQKAGPLVVGSRYNADTLRVREFLSRNHVPYQWEDPEDNEEMGRFMKEFQIREDQMPVVVVAKCDDKLFSPSNDRLARELGILKPIESKMYDLVVVGAGPAGLAAGVYGASEGLSTIVVDSNSPGGQAGTSSRIENYVGYPFGVSGQALTDSAVVQAERFGAQMLLPAKVTTITCSTGGHTVQVEGREAIECKCVILASGASYRKLDFDGMDEFEGRGIYYSATHVERLLCADNPVAIVGAGNSAGQAAVFMAENAAKVLLVVRGDDLRKTMSSYLATRIESSQKIEVLLNAEICELRGDGHVQEAFIVNRKDGSSRTEAISGVFVMIGAVPHTQWLPEAIVRDSKGFVYTGPGLVPKGYWSDKRPPFFLETSCPGVFAAGDARAGSVKRVASAVGEGSMAVAFVHQYLAL